MCQCVHKLIDKTQSIIDSSLTTQNASEKGYRFVSDIPNLYKTLHDLIELAEKKGYKIGEARNKKGETYFGLYSKSK